MRTAEASAVLPDIPAKRYFAIGEVAELCDVKPHVLRYWEQEFSQLRPVKRRGNRRYYQQDDVLLVRRIRSLLYDQGFTIGGARQQLREHHAVMEDHGLPDLAANESLSPATGAADIDRGHRLKSLRDELESLLRLIDADRR